MVGTHRVPLSACINATIDQQVRQIDQTYVTRLITQMETALKNGRDVPLPPACGLVDGDVTENNLLKGDKTVTIIGGNHTLLACKKLEEQFPNANCLKYRYVPF